MKNKLLLIILIGIITFNFMAMTSAQDLAACDVLNTTNSIYTLTGNVNSSGTCFTIGANNVTLDCNSYVVNYSQSALGYGVNNSGGYNFTTVKNCNFVEGSVSGNNNYGIYYYNAYNGTISNNIINTYKIDTYGAYLYNSRYQNISNNNITTAGNSAYGIYLRGTSNSVINANNLYATSGSSGQYALYLYNAASNNIISYNNINATSASACIRLFSSTDYNKIIYNNVTTGSGNAIDISGGTLVNISYNKIIHLSGSTFGIYFNTAGNAITFYNDINMTGSSSVGIYLFGGSNHDIEFNNISSSGNGAMGIQVRVGSNSNYFNSNNIWTYGTGNVGVRFRAGSKDNVLNNSNILTFSNGGSYPMDLYDTSNNFTIYNSKVNASSGDADFIIRASPGGIWSFTNVTKSNNNPISVSWTAGQNGTLNMYWYLDANVTNNAGAALSGANVSIYYGNGTYFGSSLTNSNGAARFTLLGFTQNSSSEIYYSAPYIANVSKELYTPASNNSVNMSNNVLMNIIMGLSDTILPASVTNLENQSSGQTWIYWNWTNPADADFNSNIIFIDDVNLVNTSNNYYNATGFSCGTSNTIKIWTKDNAGNVNNTNVTSTSSTSLCPDTTPPSSITGLQNQSSSQIWIYWNWTNPADADFNSNIIFIDDVNLVNTSNNYYNATGLTCETSHTIKINTKDNSGNINYTNVTSTASTSACNYVPIITTPSISPATAYTDNDLNCSFTVTDEDADSLSVNYTWYNGTSAIISGSMSVSNGTEASIILGNGNTTKNEAWNCSIIPYDTKDYGTEKSATKTISNSLPSAPVVDVLPNSPTDDEDLAATVSVASTDLDNDSITYSYQWYKNDSLQVGQTSNTLSKLLTTIGDNWKCIVTPNDGTGNGATAQDTVTISSAPDTNAPVITIVNPSNGTSLSTGTTETYINITTNENATCRYSTTNSAFLFSDGINFTIDGNSEHSFLFSGLSDGQSYTIYYKCNDTSGNINSASITHTFSVSAALYCGDGSCNNGETCSTCSADCGSCSGGGSHGGGGGGSGGEIIRNNTAQNATNVSQPTSPSQQLVGCNENWQCGEWTECTIEGLQVRACNDLNSCGTSISKPSEIQNCIKPTCSDNIQNQEELGIDCGGPCARRCGVGELSGKIVEVPSPEKSEKSKYGILLIFLLVGLIGMLTMVTRMENRVKAHIHKSRILTHLHEHHHETPVSADASHVKEIGNVRLKLLLMNIVHIIIIIVIIAVIYYFIR